MKLTDTLVRNARPTAKPQKLFDGNGLYLLLQPNGARWWRLKFRFNGVEKSLSLGTYPEVSLRRARERREEFRKEIANGIDPSMKRRAEKRARANSFEAIAREWFDEHSPKWTQAYATLVMKRFERNLFPWVGSKPVHMLEAADFLDCFKRIQKRGALETAHRARSSASEVMRYAVATRRAQRDPVVDLKGALPPANPTHFASIKDPKKVGELLRAIDGYQARYDVVQAAVRLLPLVFVRPTELRRASWEEFNLDEAQWRMDVSDFPCSRRVALTRVTDEALPVQHRELVHCHLPLTR